MYTKEQLEVAKVILLNLISDGRELKARWKGICYNADQHILNKTLNLHFYGFITEFSEGWERHTGNESYPVQDDWDHSKWKEPTLPFVLT